MKKIILASTSPRRKDILSNMGIEFDIVSPDFDESLINKTFSYEKIEKIAENKCESAINKINESGIVISADTVVIYDNKVMGKPKDYDEAFKMLSILNGNSHKVVTAICIIDKTNGKKLIDSETSEVSFNKISEDDIKNYIDNYKPFDKAGSYGIQELPKHFIKNIKGEYDNIVGLPTKTLINMFKEINLR